MQPTGNANQEKSEVSRRHFLGTVGLTSIFAGSGLLTLFRDSALAQSANAVGHNDQEILSLSRNWLAHRNECLQALDKFSKILELSTATPINADEAKSQQDKLRQIVCSPPAKNIGDDTFQSICGAVSTPDFAERFGPEITRTLSTYTSALGVDVALAEIYIGKPLLSPIASVALNLGPIFVQSGLEVLEKFAQSVDKMRVATLGGISLYDTEISMAQVSAFARERSIKLLNDCGQFQTSSDLSNDSEFLDSAAKLWGTGIRENIHIAPGQYQLPTRIKEQKEKTRVNRSPASVSEKTSIDDVSTQIDEIQGRLAEMRRPTPVVGTPGPTIQSPLPTLDLSAFNAAVSLSGFVLSQAGKTKNAAVVVATGSAISMFAEQELAYRRGEKGPLALLGAYGNTISTFANIVQFANADSEGVVLKGLRLVADEIQAFREEFRASTAAILAGEELILKRLATAIAEIEEIRSFLTVTRQGLSNRIGDLYTYVASEDRSRAKTVDFDLVMRNARGEVSERLEDPKQADSRRVRDCISSFVNWALSAAKEPAFIGNIAAKDLSSEILGRGEPVLLFGVIPRAYAILLQDSKVSIPEFENITLANPAEWALGTEAFLELKVLFPERQFSNPEHVRWLFELWSTGITLRRALLSTSNKDVVSTACDTMRSAGEAYSQLIDAAIKRSEQEVIGENPPYPLFVGKQPFRSEIIPDRYFNDQISLMALPPDQYFFEVTFQRPHLMDDFTQPPLIAHRFFRVKNNPLDFGSSLGYLIREHVNSWDYDYGGGSESYFDHFTEQRIKIDPSKFLDKEIPAKWNRVFGDTAHLRHDVLSYENNRYRGGAWEYLTGSGEKKGELTIDQSAKLFPVLDDVLYDYYCDARKQSINRAKTTIAVYQDRPEAARFAEVGACISLMTSILYWRLTDDYNGAKSQLMETSGLLFSPRSADNFIFSLADGIHVSLLDRITSRVPEKMKAPLQASFTAWKSLNPTSVTLTWNDLTGSFNFREIVVACFKAKLDESLELVVQLGSEVPKDKSVETVDRMLQSLGSYMSANGLELQG